MINNAPFSISDKALIGLEPFDGFQLLSEHGFTHIHFSYKWRSAEFMTPQEMEQMRQSLEDAKMKVLDVHGPHPNGADFGSEDPEKRQIALDKFRYRLKLTHELGCTEMVYHVPTREFNDNVKKRYLETFKELEDEIRGLGIKIAIENHYNHDIDRIMFPLCFEAFDPEYIGFTFDPGHANISGNLQWLVENCMERLSILHLNDNDTQKDQHWVPYQEEGVIDWDELIRTIAKSPYDKPLQMEVSWRAEKQATREEFVAAAQSSAQRLQEIFTASRK